VTERVIGLALSGGGSRAAAFHLGCLRALHDRDLLRRVRVVSGISGGSLLGALWAYGPVEFDEFDDEIVRLLNQGLQTAIARRALRPMSLARGTGRTEALASVLTDTVLGTKIMSDVTHREVDVVLTATDIRTGNAVRFGSAVSSCSRFGSILERVPVATAVAASAAFPVFLPAMKRTFTFERDGKQRQETVLMSDGGIYDNLGLSVLAPGRSTAYTPHVYDVPYVVSCDAGRGELRMRSPHLLIGRLRRSFDVVHRRAQDGGRAQLHEWLSSGHIKGFAMAYLGLRDERLPVPLVDLVPRASVTSCGTNFAAMGQDDLERLSARGEQLLRSLLPVYCPELT
jgi:NTE family protein